MKRFRRLLNKKGFTLAELMVSVGVMAVLMAMMVSLFTPINRMITDTRRDTRMDGVLENVSDYIRRSVDVSQRLEAYKITDATNINAALADFALDSDYTVHALYLDGNGQLYDLGTIPSGSDIDTLTTLIAADITAVFLPAYYNNCILRHSISETPPSSGVLQISSVATRGGQPLTGNRITSFNLIHPTLQMDLEPDPIDNNDNFGIVILYNKYVKDFT